MRYVIVLNEEAGKAGKTPPGGTPDEIREAFTRAGVDADVRLAGPGQVVSVIRSVLQPAPDAVIVGGGDGTVRSAAAVLAGTGVPLGVLPMGTFNHFAKDLGVPADLAEAVAALAAGAARDVDLGEVNGHVFINNCSIGAYAQAVRRRDALRDRHGFGKWWAMLRASWDEFRRLRPLRLRIRTKQRVTDGSAEEKDGGRAAPARLVRTPAVMVGNNAYSGRLFGANLRPRLDEGKLWLYVVRARRHFPALRMMLQAAVRRLDEIDTLDAEPAREIVIESACGPLPIAADGEVLSLSAPLRLRIRPGALRVLGPMARREAGGEGQEEGRRTASLRRRTGKKRQRRAARNEPEVIQFAGRPLWPFGHA